MSDFELKIAKPGYDVKTAEEKDLIYSSEMATPKIASDGTYTATSSAMVDIAHSLGYVPIVMLYEKPSGGAWKTKLLNYDIDEYVSDAKLRVWLVNGSKLRYFFLYEPSLAGVTGVTPSNDDYGLVISKPGYDVKTAKAHELSFNSAWGTFSIISTLSDTLVCSGTGSRSKTVAHNLGYVPAFLCKFSTSDTYYWTGVRVEPQSLWYFQEEPPYDQVDLTYYLTVDDTNIYFNQNDGGVNTTETVSFTAYLFNQKLE